VALLLDLSRVIEREESIMKHIRTAIALSGLLVLLTFSSALGQSDRQTIYIPFAFSVGEKAFSAGKYTIERNRKDSEDVWLIRDKESGEAALFLTNSLRANKTQEQTRFVFHRYEDLYLLSEIWIDGSNNGRQVVTSNRQRAIEKALAEKRQDVILTSPGR
jgi:hypothetical protein